MLPRAHARLHRIQGLTHSHRGQAIGRAGQEAHQGLQRLGSLGLLGVALEVRHGGGFGSWEGPRGGRYMIFGFCWCPLPTGTFFECVFDVFYLHKQATPPKNQTAFETLGSQQQAPKHTAPSGNSSAARYGKRRLKAVLWKLHFNIEMRGAEGRACSGSEWK